MNETQAYNLEAERVLLGNVMLDNACIPQVLWQLSASDFSLERHRLVFNAMRRLDQQKRAVDPLTVQEDLTHAEQIAFQATPGAVTPLEIAELLNGVPRLTKLNEYVEQVRGASIKRHALNIGNWLRNEASDISTRPDELVASLRAKVDELSATQFVGDIVTTETAIDRTMQELEERWAAGRKLIGLNTGFDDLNYLTGGLRGGRLYTIAAPPGMGKTTFALNLAQNAIGYCESGVLPVGAIITLEMSVEEVTIKQLATFTRIDVQRIEMGIFRGDERRRFDEAVTLLRRLPVSYVENFSRVTAGSIAARVEQIRAEHKRIDFLIVDYLQLLDSDAPRESEVARLTEITRTLKRLAVQYKIPVIALSQMSRDGVNWSQEPQLKHLRGSGSIEQDSDVVMFIWPSDPNDPEGMMKKLLIKKQRGGPKGVVELVFFGSQSRFEAAARVGDYAASAPSPVAVSEECPF